MQNINTSSLNLLGLRDDGRMILPVLERISGSVTFWCGFGAKATNGFASAGSLKTSAGPLCSVSFCDFTTVNIAGAAASSALLHWSCKGEVVAAGWTWESASALTACSTKLTRASVDWLGAQIKLGSNRGAVGALLHDLVSGGCGRAALDLTRLLEKGAQSFFFSFVIGLLQSCSSLDLIAASDLPKIRHGRKVGFQHKSNHMSHLKSNLSLRQCHFSTQKTVFAVAVTTLAVGTAKDCGTTNWLQHLTNTTSQSGNRVLLCGPYMTMKTHFHVNPCLLAATVDV